MLIISVLQNSASRSKKSYKKNDFLASFQLHQLTFFDKINFDLPMRNLNQIFHFLFILSSYFYFPYCFLLKIIPLNSSKRTEIGFLKEIKFSEWFRWPWCALMHLLIGDKHRRNVRRTFIAQHPSIISLKKFGCDEALAVSDKRLRLVFSGW